MDIGDNWTSLPPKDDGLDVGQQYEPCCHRSDEDPSFLSDHEEGGRETATGQGPHHSPLSQELDPCAEVTSLLDDYAEIVDKLDPEIAMAVVSITEVPDVEM